MSFAKLNNLKNLEVRTNAAGQRRRTVARNDAFSKEMEAANTPEAMGKLAAKYGINEDEIFTRAKSAPNFGQFRMTLGNRIRNIARRRKGNPGMSLQDAAYPPKRVTPGRKKVAKKTGAIKKKAGGPVKKKLLATANNSAPGSTPAGE